MLRESGLAGIKPAICKSQVQRPTAEPPRNTETMRDSGISWIHTQTICTSLQSNNQARTSSFNLLQVGCPTDSVHTLTDIGC